MELLCRCVHVYIVLLYLFKDAYSFFNVFLQDPLFFVNAHQKIGDAEKNGTTLRLLHYPPLGQNTIIKPGQLRCGEHVDYGSVTLLFQDPIGGLQVCTVIAQLKNPYN